MFDFVLLSICVDFLYSLYAKTTKLFSIYKNITYKKFTYRPSNATI
jgi:hypothetical protein